MKTLLLGLLALVAFQDKKPAAFTDPAQAGPDWQIQGEYQGDSAAAQVVALGNGAFDVYFLGGGLPGAGWDQKTRLKASARCMYVRAPFFSPCSMVDATNAPGAPVPKTSPVSLPSAKPLNSRALASPTEKLPASPLSATASNELCSQKLILPE